MNGKDILANIQKSKAMSEEDFAEYCEGKLADAIDKSNHLISEHEKNGEKYTDTGHASSIGLFKQFLTSVKGDLADVTEKIEMPKDEMRPKPLPASSKGKK